MSAVVPASAVWPPVWSAAPPSASPGMVAEEVFDSFGGDDEGGDDDG
ncbi:hypothetical protein NKG94_51220 [Micromonospora sp. M12]